MTRLEQEEFAQATHEKYMREVEQDKQKRLSKIYAMSTEEYLALIPKWTVVLLVGEDNMTAKFDSFIAALENLCEVYGVSIDCGYDGIQIWNNPVSGSGTMFDTFSGGVNDRTDYECD